MNPFGRVDFRYGNLLHEIMTKQAHSFRSQIRDLYFGDSRRATVWRLSLLAFDIITIGYFVFSSLLEPHEGHHTLDFIIALVLALDYVGRLIAANDSRRYVLSFTSATDIIVILSLTAPVIVDNLGFLRVVRMLRLMRSYHVLKELRRSSPWFKRNEEIIHSAINLFVFIFVVTAVVFVLEGHHNPHINTYFDALYFTVTTLTTTGFGDITMTDSLGRMMTVVIMIFGVALFLRLVQTIFRPAKVHYVCPRCGLSRHDPDAVHCKHCGKTINIPTEGDWS